MSQTSTMASDGQSRSSGKAPTGTAVLLLAVAVIVGIGLLHELDDTSASATGDIAASEETAGETVVDQSSVTSTTAPARTPAEIKVLVANGTTVNGAAAKLAARLQPVGYQLLKPGNTTRTDWTTSGVQYAEGYQTEAQAVATALGMPATAVQPLAVPAPLADMQAANVLVIVGNDLATATNASQGTGAQQGATTQQNAANTVNNALNGPLTRSNGSSTTTIAGTSGVASAGTGGSSSSGSSGNSNLGAVTTPTVR